MKLPPIGLGCSPLHPGGGLRDLAPVIATALDLGYPLLDTAELYGTEATIGQALARRPSRRADVCLISKLWSTHHRPHLVRAACERSLRALGVDHLDLYLIHAPRPWRRRGGHAVLLDTDAMQAQARAAGGDPAFEPDDVPIGETWQALEALRDDGLVAAIGVSNFAIEDLGALLAAGAHPAVNQIARDPLRPRRDLTAFCRRRGITVMAHSPLATPGLLEHPAVVAIARRCGRSAAQVVLRWNIEAGITPLPGTRREAHLVDNLAAAERGWTPGTLADLDRLPPHYNPDHA